MHMSNSSWEREFQRIIRFDREHEIFRRRDPVTMASFDSRLANAVTYQPTVSEFSEGGADEHFFGLLEAVAQEHMLDPDQVHVALRLAELLLPEAQA